MKIKNEFHYKLGYFDPADAKVRKVLSNGFGVTKIVYKSFLFHLES
jgi:hypothetical protein